MALTTVLTACSGDSDTPIIAFDQEGVRLVGKVFDATTGEPIRDAIVRTDPPSESVSTDINGIYAITDTVNGTGAYQVIATHTAYESGQTTVTGSYGTTSNVDIAMNSNVRGLHASSTLLQFTDEDTRKSLLLTSNIANTSYAITTTSPWVTVDTPFGKIVNRELIPITVNIAPDLIPPGLPASSQVLINPTNGTRPLVIAVQVQQLSNTSETHAAQLDCRQPNVLRVGLDDPNAPLIQFLKSQQLPGNTGTRVISVPKEFFIDSFVLSELGTVTIEHISGGPDDTSLEIFELDLDRKVKTIAQSDGTSPNNRRASLSWALIPGVYCYYIGGTTANFSQLEQLEVRLGYTSPP